MTWKETSGRCSSEFIDWRYNQSCWYFRTSFMNCCPSNLLSGSTLPLLLFPVWISIYTVYKYKWKGGGVWGSGPQTDENLPQSPFIYRWIFLENDNLNGLPWILSFYDRNPLSTSVANFLQEFSARSIKKTGHWLKIWQHYVRVHLEKGCRKLKNWNS